jgi:hypothetical protein
MLLIAVEPVDKPERGKWLRQERVVSGSEVLRANQRLRQRRLAPTSGIVHIF